MDITEPMMATSIGCLELHSLHGTVYSQRHFMIDSVEAFINSVRCLDSAAGGVERVLWLEGLKVHVRKRNLVSTMRSCSRLSRKSPANVSSRSSSVCRAVGAAKEKKNWRETSKPIKPGSTYPAKEFCSNCGLCDTYYVAHVKDACAFLGDGTPFHQHLVLRYTNNPRSRHSREESLT